MKKHSNLSVKSEQRSKQTQSRIPVQRDTKELMAELLGKLTEKRDPKAISASGGKEQKQGRLRPNLDRLTVGVDLGDKWSAYCILGLEGETLIEAQLQTTPPGVTEFFQSLPAARVVVEVGTHSAWVRELISGCGHEVLRRSQLRMCNPDVLLLFALLARPHRHARILRTKLLSTSTISAQESRLAPRVGTTVL